MLLLQGARERVSVLQFSPDGCGLAAPCVGGVQLWADVTVGGPPTAVLPCPRVGWVRFTPDGQGLLLDGLPSRVVVHDLRTGGAAEVPLQVPGFGGSCDLTPDGRLVVACQSGGDVELPTRLCCRPLDDLGALAWSVSSPRLLYSRPVFLAGGRRFVVLEFRHRPPAGGRLVYVTRDTGTGEAVAEAPASEGWFEGLVHSPDGRLLAGRRGALIGVLPADDLGATPVTFRNDSRRHLTRLAFHPSGRFLAATSNDATVKLYDTATWKLARAFDWGVGRLRSVAFSPDGMLAAAGGEKGQVVVWDVDL